MLAKGIDASSSMKLPGMRGCEPKTAIAEVVPFLDTLDIMA